METEKFDLDDDQEVNFDFPEREEPDTGHVAGTIEDDKLEADNEDLHEQFAFVKGMLGENALEDKRNTYKLKEDNGWPEYEYETEGGKKIVIRHDTMGTFWRILFVPGGQLPRELEGRFTSQEEAKLAVKLYLAKR